MKSRIDLKKNLITCNFKISTMSYFDNNEDVNRINELIDQLVGDDKGAVSDGHHTFDELYDQRMAYNAAFFVFAATNGMYDVHKSCRHSDGQLCFGGVYFVVVAELPTGQITQHYKMKDWDYFPIPERETANQWDGHAAGQGLTRLKTLLTKHLTPPKIYKHAGTYGTVTVGFGSAEQRHLGISSCCRVEIDNGTQFQIAQLETGEYHISLINKNKEVQKMYLTNEGLAGLKLALSLYHTNEDVAVLEQVSTTAKVGVTPNLQNRETGFYS